jgi:type II secretory pathway component GspD/PulD (secretin)
VAIALIDTPVAKVTFDVQVLDVQPTKDSNVGILFGGIDSTGKTTNGSTFTAFANRLLPLNATINALISEGAATVLARPSIAVANGKTAKILVGEQYPIVITNGSLVGGQNVQFVPIGVQLQLTPTVGSDGTITVDLTTTYSELNGTEPISQYPIIGQRTVQSIIPVRDGEPIVVAGLFQTIDSSTVSKVPLLSSIPVFGEIFKNRQHSTQHDEIIFALYPHIGVAAAQPEVTDVHH